MKRTPINRTLAALACPVKRTVKYRTAMTINVEIVEPRVCLVFDACNSIITANGTRLYEVAEF